MIISHFLRTRRRAAPQAPAESEWNFIAVPADELHWCVLWEYARSSAENWVETTVQAWFKRKLGNGTSVSEFLSKHGGRFSLRLRHLFGEAKAFAPVSLKMHWPFYELVTRLPEFPKPWTLLDPDRRKFAVEIPGYAEKLLRNPWPSIWEPTTAPDWVQHEMHSLLPDPGLNALLNHLRKEHIAQIRRPPSLYILAIDLGTYRKEDTLAKFNEWLKSESDRQRKRKFGREGRGPSDSELLRYLVSWRFKMADLTFDEAQEILGKCAGDDWRLPKTDDPSRWSKNIAAATKYARVFFPKPDKELP